MGPRRVGVQRVGVRRVGMKVVLDESGFGMKVVFIGMKVVLDEIYTFGMKVVLDEVVFYRAHFLDLDKRSRRQQCLGTWSCHLTT